MNPQQQYPQGQPPVVVVKKGTSPLVIVLAILGGLVVLGFGGCVLCVGAAGKGISEAEKQIKEEKKAKEEAVQVKSGGGEGEAKKGAAAVAKIGDTVVFDDSEWTVLSVKDLGSTAASNNEFQQPAKSDGGHFVLVKFAIKNNGKKEDSIFDQPKLIDSKDREFGHAEHQMFYVPAGSKTLDLETIPVGLKKEYYSVYEVPNDAKGLKFRARALAMDGATKPVDLGI